MGGFVIAMYTENRGLNLIKSSFALSVSIITVIVCTHISQDNDDIVFGQMKLFTELDYVPRHSVDISGIENHSLTPPGEA